MFSSVAVSSVVDGCLLGVAVSSVVEGCLLGVQGAVSSVGIDDV